MSSAIGASNVASGRTWPRLPLALLVAILVAALGTVFAVVYVTRGQTCRSGTVLNIVAHQDDDLLFLSPRLLHEVRSGSCVRTVFVTSGGADLPTAYWESRELGSRAAYARMVGVSDDWTSQGVHVSGKTVPAFSLRGDTRISLVFLRLPDGAVDGSGEAQYDHESLQRLFTGAIPTIRAVDGSATYTKSSLQDTLLALMNTFRPGLIQTMDYVGSYGDGDHSDHHTVARLTLGAQLEYRVPHEFTGYAGYGIAAKPSNVSGQDLADKTDIFVSYAAHDNQTCGSAQACESWPEGAWLSRQYTVSIAEPMPTSSSSITRPASG